jgi:BirA family biotin operon repressor/biotin-[acetyl-CoA-carboxylase] ligase
VTAGAFHANEPVSAWQGEAAADLALRWGIPALHAFRRIGSTSDVARDLAEQGAPAGTAVVADEQVAGRGRVGRTWSSPPGLGLWLSMIARPAALQQPGILPLLVGLEVAGALDAFLGAGAVGLKWPNDLLVGGRKLGGILCEAAWSGAAPAFVVVGVGINVLHQLDDFPAEMRAAAASLRTAGAGEISPLAVADRVVPALHARLRGAVAMTPELHAALRQRDLLVGRAIAVSDPSTGEERGRGIAAGIGLDGALLLREPSGAIRPIHAGTIRLTHDEDSSDS